jgi:formate hydrogenlyase subunit 6/NADH:ubiquinone oxidoreductase subunit I
VKLNAILRDVLVSIFRRPATEKYPFEKQAAPDALRGKLTWDPTKCSGCCLCVKDCPSNALEVITIDKATKRFVMRYHADRCTYCSQCVQNCRFDCIQMSPEDWELAATTKAPFTLYYGREADVDAFLAHATPPATSNSNGASRIEKPERPDQG